MVLTRYTLKNIPQDTGVVLPGEKYFDLPEKVLQFGTGVLLRGLPDYFIDKANRQGIFNGRIVVVKSTESGDSSAFEKQDNLYTVCVRGIENGKKIEENLLNASVSRVLNAKNEWGKVLQSAHSAEMKVVISNTTEVGISFVNDDIWKSPRYHTRASSFLFSTKGLGLSTDQTKVALSSCQPSSSWTTGRSLKQLCRNWLTLTALKKPLWTGWKIVIIFVIRL